MPYIQVICMKCACEYIQETDPAGERCQINVYMCGACGSREIYKKELTKEEVNESIEEYNRFMEK